MLGWLSVNLIFQNWKALHDFQFSSHIEFSFKLKTEILLEQKLKWSMGFPWVYICCGLFNPNIRYHARWFLCLLEFREKLQLLKNDLGFTFAGITYYGVALYPSPVLAKTVTRTCWESAGWMGGRCKKSLCAGIHCSKNFMQPMLEI